MPKSKPAASGSHDLRACTECRKRKSKCSGISPCSYCTRANKRCIFGPPPSRTPLTRKNLDAVELRCAGLVSLIQRLDPDVDIESLLETILRNPDQDFQVSAERSRSLNPGLENSTLSDQTEWNESSLLSPSQTQDVPLDGMATLPSRRAESGYLGNSSGSNILRTISDILPVKSLRSRGSQQGQSSPADTNHTGSPTMPINLADTTTMNGLIDAYFMWYNPSYPIIHEKTFREEYQNRHHIHPRSSWHSIFFLVLAIGHWTLTEDSEAEQSRYYTAARSRMSMRMLESGNLLTVQTFLLMGNYLQKRDRPNTGYNFIGIAYRMALGLGLHREPPGGMTSSEPFSNQRRRVIWWIAYCFDSGFSFTTGRPIMVSDTFIETKLPRNVDDSTCTLEAAIPDSTEYPTSYSAIIAQSRMASIGNVVFSEIISSSNQSLLDLRISRSIDNQLKAWKLSLPSYFAVQTVPEWFRGPRAIVLWKEENIRLLLWWGTKRMCTSPTDHEEAQNMCNFTAVETIQDISNFCRDNSEILHTGVSWYATYYLFQAAVVLSIHHLRPMESINRGLGEVSQELWFSSITRSRDCLASLSRTNTAATRCLEVLERISDQSQHAQHQSSLASESQAIGQPEIVQHEAVPGDVEIPSTMLAVDPTLQMLFEDTSWDKDIFQGLDGFPSTGEGEAFDYVPSNTDQGWLRSSDPGGQDLNYTQ